VPPAVEHALHRQDSIGGNEIFDQLPVGPAGRFWVTGDR